MKKYAYYIVLLSSYFLFFILSCTKEYTDNPNPPTTTSSSTSSGSTSSGSTTASTTAGTSTAGTTTAGTSTAGTTTAGTTTAGTTTAGTTTAGTTTAGTTTSGTTTSAPCTPSDNSFSASNGVGSGNFTSVTAATVSGYYGITGLTGVGYPSLEFMFLGTTPPAAGVYDIAPLFPTTATEVNVSLYLSTTSIYFPFTSSSSPGKVYVDVSGGTVTVTGCSVKLANPTSLSDSTTVDGKVIKP